MKHYILVRWRQREGETRRTLVNLHKIVTVVDSVQGCKIHFQGYCLDVEDSFDDVIYMIARAEAEGSRKPGRPLMGTGDRMDLPGASAPVQCRAQWVADKSGWPYCTNCGVPAAIDRETFGCWAIFGRISRPAARPAERTCMVRTQECRTMYEFLITNLRNCAEANSLSRYKRELMKQAADVIEELSKQVELEHQSGFADGQIAANRKKLRWIPVTDRLPSPMRAVLVWTPYKHNVFMAYLQGNKWYVWGPDDSCCHNWPEYHTITHWMPLPESPKEKKK